MGWSEKRTDFFGNEYTQHFDDHGNKAGWSENRTGFFGDKYEQHYNEDNDKAGWSENRTGFFGDKYEQHYNEDNDRVGWSQTHETFLFGDKYKQDYDNNNDRTDTHIQGRPRSVVPGSKAYSDARETRQSRTSASLPRSADSAGGISVVAALSAIAIVGLLVAGLSRLHFGPPQSTSSTRQATTMTGIEGVFVPATTLPDARPRPAQQAQQERMRICNAAAGDHNLSGGQARRSFMSECLAGR